MITRSRDPYDWEISSNKKYLFTKQISKHSTKAHQDLYHSVGSGFQAIPKGKKLLQEIAPAGSDTLYITIAKLQAENAILKHDIENAKKREILLQKEIVIAEKRLHNTERHNSILLEVAKFYYDKII